MRERTRMSKKSSILRRRCLFFAERRLIVFEDTGFFKNAGAELAEYIPDMPETTYFIFIENEVDKRSRLYKAVEGKRAILSS